MPFAPYRTVALALALAWLGIALWTSARIVVTKRDARAAIAWTGLVWLVPYFGALLYLILGVNRVQRRAQRMWSGAARYHTVPSVDPCDPADLADGLAARVTHLSELARLVEEVTARPLLPGNHVEVLVNGDAAYPRMCSAIDNAKRSVAIAMYIFDDSTVGRRIARQLADAHCRGVAVRVLIDDVGSSDSSIDLWLREHGVPAARFLPVRFHRRWGQFNLRNHRKLLIIDGTVGFTGGMNILAGHEMATKPDHPVRDLHFQLEGPVVAHLGEVFAEDWEFATGEALDDDPWFADLTAVGDVFARGIAEGPDTNLDRIRWTLLGALSCARKSVRITTPYFLPDQTLITAIRVAAMRGVRIDIVIPERSDVRVVDWASRAQLWQVTGRNVRIWTTPFPFDHTKLMIVDDYWSFIGSANWDPRSLRLNFEFNVECYDANLALQLGEQVDKRICDATRLTAEILDSRSQLARVRDGAARLLMPYL